MSKVKPLVAIHCLVYNHEPYLRDCFEGFVMQQTTFPFVAIVHDDASTDNSAAIIREYEAKYPHIFKPIYEKENLYQKGGFVLINEVMNTAIEATGAKYVAKCEGDDYWTDPLKLKKQVDFMEANPEYSVCFHYFKIYDVHNDQWRKPAYTPQQGGEDVTTTMFLRIAHYGQPLTMLFRVSNFDYQWSRQYKYYRDTHEIYHLLQVGKGRILSFVGGVYDLHNGGVCTSMTNQQNAAITREIYKELYIYNPKDKVLRSFLYKAFLWNYDVFPANEFYEELKRYFCISPSIVFRVIVAVLKRKAKCIVRK